MFRARFATSLEFASFTLDRNAQHRSERSFLCSSEPIGATVSLRLGVIAGDWVAFSEELVSGFVRAVRRILGRHLSPIILVTWNGSVLIAPCEPGPPGSDISIVHVLVRQDRLSIETT